MIEQLLSDLSFFKPELTLVVTFLTAILTDLVFRRSPVVVAAVCLAGFALTGIFILGQNGEEALIFGNMLTVDAFAVFFKVLITLSAILVLVFSLSSAELNTPGRSLGEYYSLLVALTLGMILMAGATNLLMIYLAIELSSMTSYILTGYTREAPDSSEASLKYVIYGGLSSGIMLYGISILYGLTGTLDLYQLNQVLATGDINDFTLLIAGVFTMVGFGYKISAVPFHFWTPDVYEGAPITITAFLSVASKAAGFAVFIRFLKVAFVDAGAGEVAGGFWTMLQGFDWPLMVAIVSVLTMTLGNLVALWQDNMKRLLAYSSIAHAGYLLMGVVVMGNEGTAAVLIYFIAYLFMNLGAFYVVMLIANKTGSEDVEDYRGLAARAPFLSLSLSLFLISLTGLPPTVGFIGKLYLFAALLNSGWIWLAVVGGINTVISLYYYVKVFRNMYLREDEEKKGRIEVGAAQLATLVVLLVPIILFFFYFPPIVEFAQASIRIFGTP
ncbi:MAG: NADH-quinone oxidoreductase subunit N [Ignavibacteria bacterium]|nr:NADH-quinone oxidoreductase subunit N [Ignavibacteria bacterium]